MVSYLCCKAKYFKGDLVLQLCKRPASRLLMGDDPAVLFLGFPGVGDDDRGSHEPCEHSERHQNITDSSSTRAGEKCLPVH